MAEHNTPEGKFRRMFGGVALGGAVAAYFAAPLVQFANPAALAVTGAVAGVGLLGVYNVRVVPGVKPGAAIFAWLCLVLGGSGALTTLVFAGEASQAVDSYCADTQARMIVAEQHGRPIGDAKDVLQTLRCRPQDVGALHLTRPAPATAALPDAKSGSAARTR